MTLKKESDHKSKTWQWWIEKVIIPILLAVLSGYFLLLSSGIIENPFQNQALPTATVFPTNPLKGTWSGSGTITASPLHKIGVDAGVEINGPCRFNVACGEVYIYTISCSYPLIYLYEEEGRFYFQQGDYVGSCGNAEIIYFEPKPSGDLLFHSEGDTGTFEVVLTKN